MNYNIKISECFRKEATSVLVSAQVLEGIGIWKCSFSGGKKTKIFGEKSSEQGEKQQQTQPTYDTGSEWNAGHIGGRRALLFSPSLHPKIQTTAAEALETN